MKIHKSSYLIVVFTLVVLATGVSAEIFKYEDSDGKVHYVDSESKIPKEYKSTASGKEDFPEISKVTAAVSEVRPLDESSESGGISNPSASTKLEVFVADWCGHCRALEKALTSEDIPYQRLDIEKSPIGKREYTKLGRGGIPISRINGKTIVRGNNIEKIKAAIAGD